MVLPYYNNNRFVAFTYAGDLPTGAFGWNDRGVAFTLNYVHPKVRAGRTQ